MQPNQPPYQPPVAPQPPTNFDFTAQPQYQPPAPVTPPAPDPAFSQMQTDLAEIKSALGTLTPPAPVVAAPVPDPNQPPAKQYDEWGAVFSDVDKRAQEIVDKAFQDRETQANQVRTQALQQEQQNQSYIDNTVGQLRQAGYLPPVANALDVNDQGKQAENELLGYAIALGSTDLVNAAKELKFRHDAGFRYDYASKQFVQVSDPNQQDPNSPMFGNLPGTPDGQVPQLPVGNPMQPQPQFQQPVGPRNPYMQPIQQYPPGFNAPVSGGNSFQGTQGGVPPLKAIRGSSYDSLVDAFNRTQ